jgi:hypothetical protein
MNSLPGAQSLRKRISLQPDEAMVSRFFTRSLFYRSILFAVFVLTVLTTVSAKSIKMVTTWLNPKYEGQVFHKVLVIGVAQNLEVRADFEDEMAAVIAPPGMETIPGNQILLRCAGLNRCEAENENFSRERSSDPLGPEFCAGHREVHGEA